MVCPWCSEEHPVTDEQCPITGKPLREPVPHVREERVGFSELVSEAFGLYRRNLFVFVATGLVAMGPYIGLQLWNSARMRPSAELRDAIQTSARASQEHRDLTPEEVAQLRRAAPDPKKFVDQFLVVLLLLPIFLALHSLSQAAMVPLVGDRALGGTMGPGRAWLAVGLRSWQVLATTALGTLAILVGGVFCLVPGVVVGFAFSLAMPVVMLEGRSGTGALGRSWRLMRTEWPRVVGLWLIAMLAMLLVSGSVSAVLFRSAQDASEIMAVSSGPLGTAIQVGQLVVWLLMLPLPVIVTTLVYLHARREQEGIPLRELHLQLQRAATGT
jgi:hypothetical protein